MYYSLLEKIALKNTGRRLAKLRFQQKRKLCVIPQDIVSEILIGIRVINDDKTPYLIYDINPSYPFGYIKNLFKFIVTAISFGSMCGSFDIYVVSDKFNRIFSLTAAIIGRLLGKQIILHDYRFLKTSNNDKDSLLRVISGAIEYGDISVRELPGKSSISVSCRLEHVNTGDYKTFQKNKAVPIVLVYGDFEDPRILSLAYRTHELVKQKYPRAEFHCLTFLPESSISFTKSVHHHSFTVNQLSREIDATDKFSLADTLLLLTPGGLTPFFAIRARSAGFPIIANGFDLAADNKRINPYYIKVARDSYSAAAEKIISFVDNELEYRRFASIQ
ncbi:MAG: hypothetical protein KAR42_05455 [candidate division Zixibacteria bacterium]|nr:hypothetical protein [candidate division Zixibacteria bacterium]